MTYNHLILVIRFIDRQMLTSNRRPDAGLSVVVLIAGEISDHHVDVSLKNSAASIVIVSLGVGVLRILHVFIFTCYTNNLAAASWCNQFEHCCFTEWGIA